MTLRMAVAQTPISPDPRANGAAIRSVMQRAAAAGARLVQFPEGALSGYAKEQHQSWAEVDWDGVDAELAEVVALAGRLGVWVVLGSTHRLPSPRWPHNSMYVVSDAGAVVDRYDKRICSPTEVTRFYTPGTRPVTFEVDGVVFGVAVCIEVNFPELFAEYERLGVDVVLLSAYPVDAIFATKARALAAIDNYWIGVSAPDATRHLFPSALFGPDGSVVAEVDAGSDVVVADVDRDDPAFHVALTYARPWRRDVRRRWGESGA